MKAHKVKKDTSNLAILIHQASENFTQAERRIAQILFASDLMAGLETVAKLGAKAKVSGPTVLRFVSKLGFTSFPEFQACLRAELYQKLIYTTPHDSDHIADQISDNQAMSSVLKEADAFFENCMHRTLQRVNACELEEVTELLADVSRNLYVVGGYFTSPIAELFWYHLHKLRPRTHLIQTNAFKPHEQLSDTGRRDILLLFDICHYQEEIAILAEQAHQKRSTVILITDPKLSPVSRLAHHVLTCDFALFASHESLVPCLVMVELLAVSLEKKLGPEVILRQQDMQKEEQRSKAKHFFPRPA
ncbi:MAG: MurR/RpiR family transcriptional regulator [Zymomonas mobilis subsp. pomaceae]|uniref:MurR/RpiR family transcriptional regulator n=1 Tax=Zymomonas mobilis TaxID=542 RepID=UPI0039E7AB90